MNTYVIHESPTGKRLSILGLDDCYAVEMFDCISSAILSREIGKTRPQADKLADALLLPMLVEDFRHYLQTGEKEKAERVRERAERMGCKEPDMKNIVEFDCQYAIVDAPGFAMNNKASIMLAGNNPGYLHQRRKGLGRGLCVVRLACKSNQAWEYADYAHRFILSDQRA